jgi:RNA polymerase sigma-70 factor (ECF subfamily)
MGEISLIETAIHPVKEDEASLIAKAQRDPAFFDAIYQRYLNPIYYYLLARLHDPREAEDLTAQVFLQALEDLPEYRPLRPFSAWLFTIARHRAADHFRRRSDSPLNEELGQSAELPDPLAQVLQDERLAALSRLLKRLDEEDLELLHLRFAAGLSFSEIAILLGRKESAAKMALYRLLARLESQLGKDDE